MAESQVVTFYSYKGGSGRSVLVANVAALLAKKGYNVACIDLDLEAPGLDIVFDVYDIIKGRPSIIDYFLGKLTGIEDICIDYHKIYDGLNGKLYFFYAERMPEELSKEHSDEQRKNKGIKKAVSCMMGDESGRALEELLEDIQNVYDVDYILLDASSGFTEESSVALCQSDKMVIVSRYSYQHIAGTIHILKVAKLLKEMAENLFGSFDYYIVLNNVPRTLPEKRKLELENFQEEYKAAVIYEIDELKWKDKILLDNKDVVGQFSKVVDLILE